MTYQTSNKKLRRQVLAWLTCVSFMALPLTASAATNCNIANPGSSGLSNNTVQTLNVTSAGFNAINELGLNPNLTSTASAILFQVTKSASNLDGPFAVVGTKADVIIADANGINVNGGSFVNANNVTLTTGMPNFNADGSIAGYNVTGGAINVTGAGLDASTAASLNLDSSSLAVSGPVKANALSATVNGAGATPINIAAAGSMYANSISLVSTGSGVVSTNGALTAANGDLSITAGGKINNKGSLSAGNDVNLTSSDPTLGIIVNGGAISAGDNVNINAGNNLSNYSNGTILANNDINLNSVTGTIGNDSGALMGADNSLYATGFKVIQNYGFMGATNVVNFTSVGNVLNYGELSSSDSMSLNVGVNCSNDGTIDASSLAITAGNNFNNLADGTISGGTVNIAAGGQFLANTGTISGGSVTLANTNANGWVDSKNGATINVGDLAITAPNVDTSGSTTTVGDSATITAANAYNNIGGSVTAGNNLTVSTGSSKVDNTNTLGGTLNAGNALTINATKGSIYFNVPFTTTAQSVLITANQNAYVNSVFTLPATSTLDFNVGGGWVHFGAGGSIQ